MTAYPSAVHQTNKSWGSPYQQGLLHWWVWRCSPSICYCFFQVDSSQWGWSLLVRYTEFVVESTTSFLNYTDLRLSSYSRAWLCCLLAAQRSSRLRPDWIFGWSWCFGFDICRWVSSSGPGFLSEWWFRSGGFEMFRLWWARLFLKEYLIGNLSFYHLSCLVLSATQQRGYNPSWFCFSEAWVTEFHFYRWEPNALNVQKWNLPVSSFGWTS